MTRLITSAAAVAALFAAAPTFAQTTSVFVNQDVAADEVDAVEDAVQDDFEKAQEAREFGTRPGRIGWYGSVSATATATSGNSDTMDIGIGTKFGNFDGQNAQDVRLSYKYGEANGTKNANTLAASYDYKRFFSDDFFGYGKASTKFDDFGAYKRDTFVGVGGGWRILNDPDAVWTIQAGPGFRTLESNNGVSVDEAAASIDSSYFRAINPSMFLTNDTQILYSAVDTAVSNEIGLNVAMSRALALRTSLRTEYHSTPLPGFNSTDNTLGLSIVYTLN